MILRAILVDNDVVATELFEKIVEENGKLELVKTFSDNKEVMNYLDKHIVDVSILDVGNPEINGLELAKNIKEKYPDMVFIIEVSSEEYTTDVFKLKAAGYISKPYNVVDVEYAIEMADMMVSRLRNDQVYARTFGHFDLFVGGKPVEFKSAKAKELLALLVDRQGGIVTSDQLISILWGDRPNDGATQSLASKISKTLKKELDRYGVADIVNVGRGVRSLNIDMIECDLYDYLNGVPTANRQYFGEYMSDYFWGENRIEALNRLKK